MNETPLNQLVLAEEEEERGSQVVVGFCRTLSTMWDNETYGTFGHRTFGYRTHGRRTHGRSTHGQCPLDIGTLDTGPMDNGTFGHRTYEQWTTQVVTM